MRPAMSSGSGWKRRILRRAGGSIVSDRPDGKADELTAAVLFLFSDQARFIVGHLLVIDGGGLPGEWRESSPPSPVEAKLNKKS
jgi:NAD(P)-dependent dehydrogenase (short-subunit alcohol dehydrogenase family)